jgi:hypothetical protein
MHPLAHGGQVRRTRALRQLARRADASSAATSPLAALNRLNGKRFDTFRHTRAWRRPADRASASPRPLSFGGQAVARIGRSGRTRRTALGHRDIRRPGCERFDADLGSAHADRQLDGGGVPISAVSGSLTSAMRATTLSRMSEAAISQHASPEPESGGSTPITVLTARSKRAPS